MNKAPDLIAAVRAKDLRAVQRLVAEDAALASARSERGESAVLLAIYGGAGEIAEATHHAKVAGLLRRTVAR